MTQLETLKAIEESIPVFAFVDENVMHDRYVYKKNKDLHEQITFPSIETQESAKFVFEFISFLENRLVGNSVVAFSRVEDIEDHLLKQWSALFQRLLVEQKNVRDENRRLMSLNEQIEDLKSALLSTIDKPRSREIARGVLRYRRLLGVLTSLELEDPTTITGFQGSFDEVLQLAGIEKIVELPSKRVFSRAAFVPAEGDYFFESRFPASYFSKLALDWQAFSQLEAESREVILEAVSESDRLAATELRRRDMSLAEYLERETPASQEADELTLGDILTNSLEGNEPAA